MIRKLGVLAVMAVLVAMFFALGGQDYLSFDSIKARQLQWQQAYEMQPLLVLGGYFSVYVLVTGLSLPGAAVLTLLAGALFGLGMGTLVVSFASTLGATIAFLAARLVARDAVQQRFAAQLKTVNEGIAREGAFYLFSLRLVPLFPFFLINIVMGLTPLRPWQFYWVSQIGMLAGTFVYVNAGTQLAQLQSLQDIFSPSLLLAFTLLGLLPVATKKMVDALRRRKQVHSGRWRKPAHFDRNLIVIGGGAAGLVTSYIAAAVRARVTLIEGHKMGGDCLNFGCVPSKALLRSARMAHYQRRAATFGLSAPAPTVDFAAVMERVQQVVRAIAPHDSVERYTGLGVECISGMARLITPWEVEVNGQRLTARNIVIATGARPLVPAIPGLNEVDILTSETVWNLREAPRHMVVLGGGPIGCELSQAFARLGVGITQIEMQSRLMLREDDEVSAAVQASLEQDGVTVLTGHRVVAVEHEGDEKRVICEHQGQRYSVVCDAILVAVGRVANTRSLGLDALGVPLNADGTIPVNDYLQVSAQPHILACGDVAGPYQFTHTAAHQAWYAAVNALFGSLRQFRVDYSVIPWCTFTDPEVARVGLSENEARAQGVAYEVTRYGIDDLDRAIADDEAHGFVKVLTVPGKDTILGVTIVGHHAGDVIAEFVLAMRHGLGLNKILGTIHIYPTLAESNKYAAGAWKKAHAPETLLRWVEKFHGWRR